MFIREISSGITLLFIHKHFVNNTNMFRKLKMTYTLLTIPLYGFKKRVHKEINNRIIK